MNGFIKLLIQVPVSLTVAAAAAGCQQASLNNNFSSALPISIVDKSVSGQLIIKLKRGSIACDRVGIARLSAATRVTLEFVRPMSGGACVVKQIAQDAADFSHGQKILKQNPALEWVEQDEVMKMQ